LIKELCGEDRASFGCAQDKLLAKNNLIKNYVEKIGLPSAALRINFSPKEIFIKNYVEKIGLPSAALRINFSPKMI